MRNRFNSKAGVAAVLAAAVLFAVVSPALAKGAVETTEASPESPVDLNAATVEELTAIRGIGKVTAERIVKWREDNGPFRRVEDLMKVKGIGEKSFEKLKSYVKIGKSR